ELLIAALRLVRPGGVVAYVTCSPHLAETSGVVTDVVRLTRAEQLDARPAFPGLPQLSDGPHVQLWPHRHGTDAMFCALLQSLANGHHRSGRKRSLEESWLAHIPRQL